MFGYFAHPLGDSNNLEGLGLVKIEIYKVDFPFGNLSINLWTDESTIRGSSQDHFSRESDINGVSILILEALSDYINDVRKINRTTISNGSFQIQIKVDGGKITAFIVNGEVKFIKQYLEDSNYTNEIDPDFDYINNLIGTVLDYSTAKSPDVFFESDKVKPQQPVKDYLDDNLVRWVLENKNINLVNSSIDREEVIFLLKEYILNNLRITSKNLMLQYVDFESLEIFIEELLKIFILKIIDYSTGNRYKDLAYDYYRMLSKSRGDEILDTVHEDPIAEIRYLLENSHELYNKFLSLIDVTINFILEKYSLDNDSSPFGGAGVAI